MDPSHTSADARYTEVPTSPGLGGPTGDLGSPILPSSPSHSSNNRYSDLPNMPSEPSQPGYAPSMDRDSSYSSLAVDGSGLGVPGAAGMGEKRGSYSSNLSDMPMNQTPGYTRSSGRTSSPLAAASSLPADYPEAGQLGYKKPQRGRLEVLGTGETLGWNAGEDDEKPRWAGGSGAYKAGRSGRGKKFWWIAGGVLATLAIVGVAVGLGVYFGTKPKSTTNNGTSSSDSGSSNGTPTGSSTKSSTASSTATPKPTATFGGAGSLVTFTDGTQHTYVNTFGGIWAADSNNPWLNDARPNSWTPPLNQSWDWTQTIYGVNLGGWFTTEPFICPQLYEKYSSGPGGTAIDEYTLSLNMGANLTAALTDHYNTFIIEQDFMEIAAAGLNWVRLPIPYWALEIYQNNDEPYLAKKAWPYILQALQWARKYGLRVNLDLHTVPGSQNGWNHSGRLGLVNWLNGVMGLANAQRSIDYMMALTEFVADPAWLPVVPMLGILNEPLAGSLGQQNLGAFYLHMHDRIRSYTGKGAGNGPFISIHEGFLGVTQWYSFGKGFDRFSLDVHQYTVFEDQSLSPMSTLSQVPCQWWSGSNNATKTAYGVTSAGEFSGAVNDCGLWLNGVGQGARWDGSYAGYTGPVGGSCSLWDNAATWNDTQLEGTKATILSAMDALGGGPGAGGGWFFWTWKIGVSSVLGYASSPAWHYKQGLQMGYIPADPRSAAGYCINTVGVAPTPFVAYPGAYATGGVGAGTVPASYTASYPWPPTTMSPSFGVADMTKLPQYTATSIPTSLPGLTLTGNAALVKPTGTVPGNPAPSLVYAPIAGCSYPDIYSAATLAIPTSACGAGRITQALRRDTQPTAAPKR